MNTVFLEKFSSQTVVNETNKRKRDQECNTRAVMVSMATGMMGFSGGFAVQVSGGRLLPGFVKRQFVIPALMAAYLSSRTYMYLLEDSSLIALKKNNVKSEQEKKDSVVLS